MRTQDIATPAPSPPGLCFALRPYQTAARDALLREWLAGRRATLLAMATGRGKTECFLAVLAAEYATDKAETWKGSLARARLSDRRRRWRREPTSGPQQALLRRGGVWRPGLSRGEAAQLIGHVAARGALRLAGRRWRAREAGV